MTFPVNGSIPQPNDIPSVSQGQLLDNFNNLVGWGAVDHIAYGAMNSGEHAQITLPANNPAGVQTGLESTIYSNRGTASNASSRFLIVLGSCESMSFHTISPRSVSDSLIFFNSSILNI